MSSERKIACFCNNVSIETVQTCIQNGAHTLTQLYDQCSAGVGPCGGSCRQFLKLLMAQSASQPEASHSSSAADSIDAVILQAPALYKAISLFNRRYYWETHEVLEELWLETHDNNKLFYQGLIQAAAAFYHVLNANPQGLLKLVPATLEKLAPYGSQHQGIPLEELKTKLSFFLEEAREVLGGSKVGFDYSLLPMLSIGTEMDLPG